MQRRLLLCVMAAFAVGCADNCSRLCNRASFKISDCIESPDSQSLGLTWGDFNARNLANFQRQCRAAWDAETNDLSNNNFSEVLEICKLASQDLQDMTCSELRALYIQPN